MSDCRKCAEFDWCIENEDCGLFKPKTQTNADSIRMMTDEELARFFQGYVDCLYCPQRLNEKCMDDDGSCFFAWLSWLRQEEDEI